MLHLSVRPEEIHGRNGYTVTSRTTQEAILEAAQAPECPCGGSGWVLTVHDYWVNCGCPVGPHPELEGDVL